MVYDSSCDEGIIIVQAMYQAHFWSYENVAR